MCSKAMPPQIHAFFKRALYAPQLDISPSLYFILSFSPRLTLPDFSFFALPPSQGLSCAPLSGLASFLIQNFFLKQEKEKLSGSARKPSHLGGGAAEGTLK